MSERTREIERVVTTYTATEMATRLVDLAGALGASSNWDSDTTDALYELLRPLFREHDMGQGAHDHHWHLVTGWSCDCASDDDDF